MTHDPQKPSNFDAWLLGKLSILTIPVSVLLLFGFILVFFYQVYWSSNLFDSLVMVLLIFPVLIFMMPVSVFYLIHYRSHPERRPIIPLAINWLTLFLIIVGTHSSFPVFLNFWMNLADREAVIEMVKEGELKDGDWVPADYRHVSGSKNIHSSSDQESLEVRFENSGFWLTHRSRFIYRDDDKIPTDSTTKCVGILELKKMKENWYWMQCT